MTKTRRQDTEFIGYDLGHGETAIGRAYGGSMREPEILEYRGEKSFVSAVARKGKDIKIGADAVNIAALGTSARPAKLDVWVKFKGRDINDPGVAEPTKIFTQTLFTALTSERKIQGQSQSRFIVGCPSGWSESDRYNYKSVFESAGLRTVRIVPESRAALMTALEQGYLSLDAARSSVLIVDIGSSTTDFTFCRDLEAEDVGHNVLGSGLLDIEIFNINMARQNNQKKLTTLIERYPHYRPIMEYWCRQAKEMFFNGDGAPVEMIKRLPIGAGEYFEIRMDAADAKTILSTPLDALNGYTWPDAFDFALRETLEMLDGRAPETVLLTGGASRLPLVVPACEAAFPDANVLRGAEPEFAIARGLAWLGRFEYLHAGFKNAVSDLLAPQGAIFEKAQTASKDLGAFIAPPLIDAMREACILPAFKQWRAGDIETLDAVEPVLEAEIKSWLDSPEAKDILKPVLDEWFSGLQRTIETETDPLCREHGLPAMVLSLDDSQHVSRYLDDMSLAAPHLARLETDTAIAGTTISTVLIGVLLAKANLLAPLLANPVGLIAGGVLAGGGYFYGRKALEGRFRHQNVPKMFRLLVTDNRIRKAVDDQRDEMIHEILDSWQTAASERFTAELIHTLDAALTQRANDRAVLFLI